MRQKLSEIAAALSMWPELPRRSAAGKRLFTITRSFDSSAQQGEGGYVPMLRMRGQWLERLGFAIDARVAVTEEQGRLVLTLSEE